MRHACYWQANPAAFARAFADKRRIVAGDEGSPVADPKRSSSLLGQYGSSPIGRAAASESRFPRLIPGLLLTLIVNPQHDRSPLQAHFVCETASTSRLILQEIRLGLDFIPKLAYNYSTEAF